MLFRRWTGAAAAAPAVAVLLWAIAIILGLVDALLFAGDDDATLLASLYYSGTPIFAALLAAWVLRLGATTLGLVALAAATFVAFELVWLFLNLLALRGYVPPPSWWVTIVPFVCVLGLMIWVGYGVSCSMTRRIAAIVLTFATFVVAPFLPSADRYFWRLAAQAQQPETPAAGNASQEDDLAFGIEQDRLWESQPTLITLALNGLQPRVAGTTNVYGVAIAAQGTQKLFSREATTALQVLSSRFGAQYRGGILLSNGTADLLRKPLATNGNIAAVAQGLARGMDGANDLAILYLTSHGSQDGSLSSQLPAFQPVTPISSTTLAAALDGANIRRRVVIVSACFAGTWIPALANDDTIIIAAAAPDRTSFGCSDNRRLTYFGEALLEGPLSKGASLRDAFETAKRQIEKWETAERLTPSLPQAYIGKNMQAVWTGKGRAGGAH